MLIQVAPVEKCCLFNRTVPFRYSIICLHKFKPAYSEYFMLQMAKCIVKMTISIKSLVFILSGSKASLKKYRELTEINKKTKKLMTI